MAEDQTLPQVQACRLVVGRLDSTGAPVTGTEAYYVSDALVLIRFEPVYVDGDELEGKNGCGDLYVSYRGLDNYKRGNITIQLVTPDPELQEMLSDGTVLEDGDRKGFAGPAIGQASGDVVSIEGWARRIRDGVPDPDSPWARYAYPWTTNMRVGSHTLENGVQVPEFTGQCYENLNWGQGPLDDWPVGVDATKAYQWIPTATIPDAATGYQTR